MYRLLVRLHLGQRYSVAWLHLGQVNTTYLIFGAISFLQEEQTTMVCRATRHRAYEKCFQIARPQRGMQLPSAGQRALTMSHFGPDKPEESPFRPGYIFKVADDSSWARPTVWDLS